MNKEKKTYVEPNMRVMEVETEAMMAGSGSCSGVYGTPSCPSHQCTSYISDDAKGNSFDSDEASAWKD